MPSATITSKGQITVPKEIREHLGVVSGDRLSFWIGSGGQVIVEPETVDVRTLLSRRWIAQYAAARPVDDRADTPFRPLYRRRR